MGYGTQKVNKIVISLKMFTNTSGFKYTTIKKFKVIIDHIDPSSHILHTEYIFIHYMLLKNWHLVRSVQCGTVNVAMGTITLNFLIYLHVFSDIMLLPCNIL